MPPLPSAKTLCKRLVSRDPLLVPYKAVVRHRLAQIERTARALAGPAGSLADFAAGHTHFGLHRQDDGWVLREWAPNATAIYLIGDLSGWREKPEMALKRSDGNGVWEIRLPAKALSHGDLYRLRIHWQGGSGDRIPAWARRVVQDPDTLIFNAQVWDPPRPYRWRHPGFRRPAGPAFIYEAHVGMAQDAERIGTYAEFKENIIPRIVAAGYDTIQLMAIQEHPYYASFGYHVSSFFAPSSRFGTPEALMDLIDTAHGAGLAVIIDIVHSHGVANEVEGLGRFDGTVFQYFHEGPRGVHPAWGSCCFDYAKPQILHFLLSNCRYWLDAFKVDGFRFDGVTSMCYLDHGLGKAFTGYDDYFGDNVDEAALTYLALANRLTHDLRPDAITVAEDVSGLPGLATPADQGGIGFDYRLAMGIPDYWIKLVKETPDEHWPTGHLWYELTNRRQDEATVSYCESHDQALVGDQTLIFRMAGRHIYRHMRIGDADLAVDRAVALHKMIRLLTLATAGSGYLNFMGNEFGHPEWIDFPREGNGWSYRFARRQWHLVDDPALKFRLLAAFDRSMIRLARRFNLLADPALCLLHDHGNDKVLAFFRAGLAFVFNFHPGRSHLHYRIAAPPGKYRLLLNSDDPDFGGHGRLVADQSLLTLYQAQEEPRHVLSLYLPARTAVVFKKVD